MERSPQKNENSQTMTSIELSDPVRRLIESNAIAHVATINEDGSPHITGVWVGLDGGDIVFASMYPWRKTTNLMRDPRVALSIQSGERHESGLDEYLAITGLATVTEGGAFDLLRRLALTYMGPGAAFPPDSLSHRAGYVMRVKAQEVGGVGPWTGGPPGLPEAPDASTSDRGGKPGAEPQRAERIRRDRNTETMRTWFRLQEAKDLPAWFDLWSDGATQSIPYAPSGFPNLITGKEALRKLYTGLFAGFEEVRIHDLTIDPLDDPDRVLVRWHTRAKLVNGDIYENDLVGIFEFDESGAVRHLTEYLNPDNVNIRP